MGSPAAASRPVRRRARPRIHSPITSASRCSAGRLPSASARPTDRPRHGRASPTDRAVRAGLFQRGHRLVRIARSLRRRRGRAPGSSPLVVHDQGSTRASNGTCATCTRSSESKSDANCDVLCRGLTRWVVRLWCPRWRPGFAGLRTRRRARRAPVHPVVGVEAPGRPRRRPISPRPDGGSATGRQSGPAGRDRHRHRAAFYPLTSQVLLVLEPAGTSHPVGNNRTPCAEPSEF
jgi:hypothetical protein